MNKKTKKDPEKTGRGHAVNEVAALRAMLERRRAADNEQHRSDGIKEPDEEASRNKEEHPATRNP